MTERSDYDAFLTYLAHQTTPRVLLRVPLPPGEQLQATLDRLAAARMTLNAHLLEYGDRAVPLADKAAPANGAPYSLARPLERAKQAIDHTTRYLDDTGYLDVLDAHFPAIAAHLERRHLPPNEETLLRANGLDDVADSIDALLYLARLQGARTTAGQYASEPLSTTAQLHYASAQLASALAEVGRYDAAVAPSERPQRKRKWFKGITKILGGAGTCVANLGIAITSTAGPGAAPVGYAALSSCALGVAALGDGVGDLRGE